MPDEDFVFDYVGDETLNLTELEGFRFSAFGQSQSRVKAQHLKGKRAKPTGTEKLRRNTGCGCTVIGHGHRWSDKAVQLGVAPVIAYRDAAVYPRKLQGQHRDMWKVNSRDHGRIATRANTNNSAGQREHLVGIGRTIVRGHFESKQKKKKEKKRRDK